MEAVLKELENAVSLEVIPPALPATSGFVDLFIDKFELPPEIRDSDKCEFVRSIAALLVRAQINDGNLSLLLTSLRIVLRTQKPFVSLFENESSLLQQLLSSLSNFSHLDDPSSEQKDDDSNASSTNSLKLLVNLLNGKAVCQVQALEMGLIKNLLLHLRSMKTPNERMLLCLRVLLALRWEDASATISPVLKSYLPFSVISHCFLVTASNGISFSDKKFEFVSDLAVEILCVCLRLICAMTMEYGPLASVTNPTPVSKELYRDMDTVYFMIPIMRKLFEVPKESIAQNDDEDKTSSNLTEVRAQCFNALINFPTGEIAKQMSSIPHLVDHWYQFFVSELLQPSLTVDNIVPMILFFTKIIAVLPLLRRKFREGIFPPKTPDDVDDMDLGQPVNVSIWGEGDRFALKNAIYTAFMANNPALKHVVGDFLFTLVEGRTDDLVYEVGFGAASGWLAGRGLLGAMNSSAGEGASIKLPMKEAEEREAFGLETRVGANSDLIREKKEKRKENKRSIEDLTDEEKEEEALKLVSAIDRLNELGIIKMVNPFESSTDEKK